MNKKIFWIIIIIGIVLLLILIPKPYKNGSHNNCVSYANGNTYMGYCIGTVYSKSTAREGTPDKMKLEQNITNCTITSSGSYCLGKEILKNELHIG